MSHECEFAGNICRYCGREEVKEMDALWQTEFPDFPAADMPEILAGWIDSSWRNDACPKFAIPLASDPADCTAVSIWVDYSDPAAREFPELPRFLVAKRGEEGDLIADSEFRTDDWDAAVDHAERMAAAHIAARFASVLFDWLTYDEWRDMRARNAAELNSAICHSHDFCDANMAMEEAMRACGINPSPDDADGMPDAIMDLWGESWDIAKRDHLTA